MNNDRPILHDLPVLQFLPPDVRKIVVESFTQVRFPFGSAIVREGEPSDSLYVLSSGKARVVKTGENGQEVSLNFLRPGDTFGEAGLLEQTVRSATVRASTDVETLRLDRSVFEALVRSDPRIGDYFNLQVRHRRLHNFFRQYDAFSSLSEEALKQLLDELEPVYAGEGQTIVKEGDPPGPMYVVEEGRLRVFVEESGRRRYLAYLRPGDFFGEMSVFNNTPRIASVEAASDCRLLALREDTFKRLLEAHPKFKEQIQQRISQYDYQRIARVPLDFAEETLPAEVSDHEKVGTHQLDSEKDDVVDDAAGPFATRDGRFIKNGKPIRRFKIIHQIDEMDCGAASLAMVCRFFGRSVTLARVRQLVHTARDGTSLRGICSAATELGLAARSVKASSENLARMPLPSIVHWEGNHWVVLLDVDDRHVRIADPALGRRRLRREEFERRWSGYAALFDYTEEFAHAPEGKAGLGWLMPFFRPFSRLLGQVVALAIIVSALQLVLPIFTQIIVDRVLVETDVGLLHVLVLAMGGVLLFMILALVVQRYLLSFAAVRIDAAALDFLTRRLLSLPMTYFNTRRTGDIQRRLQGVRQVRDFLVQYGVSGLTAAAQLTAVLILMFVYSPFLAGIYLVVAPLFLLLMRFAARRLRPIYYDLEDAFGRYHSYQIDAIKGMETVKSMGAEATFRELMLGQFHNLARRMFKADFMLLGYDAAIQMVTFWALIVFLLFGAHQVINGAMTIGAFVAFNALVALANAQIVVFLSLWDNWQVASVLLNRMNDVIEHEPEQGHDRSQLRPVSTLEGRVSLRKVGFRYGGAQSPPILQDINLDIPPNTTVAIVGRSGSGKTTLIKLLAGLIEPTEGTILYDGVDLKTLDYRSLRRQIGFVHQQSYLFDATIARNIAFGDDEPDMDRVLWAASVANAHEFVERLPLGYETRVGETGIALSGGQRQRITIARAVYHHPPVLIFDEATSSLDTESERAVKENMDRIFGERTAFVIAQRLSTVRDADMIVVIDRGRIVERGTHDELTARKGLYFYLCSQQLNL